MKRPTGRSSNPSKRRAVRGPDAAAGIPDGRAIERALRRAGRAALREHKRRGESIVVWKGGRVVTLAADDIPL